MPSFRRISRRLAGDLCDPALMIRRLTVGYVFAIRSERAICREVIAQWRCFHPFLPLRDCFNDQLCGLYRCLVQMHISTYLAVDTLAFTVQEVSQILEFSNELRDLLCRSN